MEKPIRKAVRCYLEKDKKVVVIKYKEGNKKSGYYDIPGGKIEKGETSEQTAIREMKEETGLKVGNLKYKGNMIIEYPNKIFDFEVFVTHESEGEPQEFAENTSEWIEINELLQKEKILTNIMILDRFFIKGLVDDKYNFKMHIQVDEKENILDVKYRLEEK
jgi:8-oxo-dGTP diphosphatase